MDKTQTLASPTVTARTTADAAGMTLRSLRNIVDRESFPLMCSSGRAGRSWRRFSAADVVRLAVLRRLMDHGLNVAEGAFILDKSVDGVLFGAARCGMDLPARFILYRLDGYRLQVSREADGFALDAGSRPLPDRLAAVRLDVEWIAEAALERLAAHTNLKDAPQ
jgi:DNA-binding transcriptional MerR regulator